MKKKKLLKENKGITLIALVITIIILLILAGIAISALTNTGLFEKAKQSKEVTNKAQIDEEVKLAITELTLGYYQGEDVQEGETLDQYIARKIDGCTTSSGATLTYEDGNIVYTDKKGNTTNIAVDENWNITVEGTTEGGTTTEEPSDPEPITPEEASATTPYVGYYADIDADGEADGVIYADLAVGGSGSWSPGTTSSTYVTYGTYTIPKVESGLKTYTISEEKYTGNFGENYVLTADGNGTDRFYVMALENLTSTVNETAYTTYYWYYNAYSSSAMTDYASMTSTDFGKGKQNTVNMLNKVAEGESAEVCYGALKDRDIWTTLSNPSYITSSTTDIISSMDNTTEKWFLPSRAEWAAFGAAFDISNSSSSETYYGNYGLNYYYWSSSQGSAIGAYSANFDRGYMDNFNVISGTYVRLSATF